MRRYLPAAMMLSLIWLPAASMPEDPLDQFAADVLAEVQPLSFRHNAEYCGLIGYDREGTLAATPPARGGADYCDIEDEPDGFEAVATYHTHGAYDPDADSEVPSIDDISGDFEEGVDGYIATPGGRLWVNLVTENATFELCGTGCLPADPAFRPCPAMRPETRYTIEELLTREANDPGHC